MERHISRLTLRIGRKMLRAGERSRRRRGEAEGKSKRMKRWW
jgi:hypothetical protein